MVNHLKSKRCSCGESDPSPPGAGCCNHVRTDAANALGRWLRTHPTGVETEDILIVGDLNSYHAESPIQALIQDFGYVDMVDRFMKKEEAYSFVSYGLSGYLDHALVSPSLAEKITQVSDWHVNAAESRVLGYRDCFRWRPNQFRHSDHDPLLIGLFEGEPSAPLTFSDFALLGFALVLIAGLCYITLYCGEGKKSSSSTLALDAPREVVELASER